MHLFQRGGHGTSAGGPAPPAAASGVTPATPAAPGVASAGGLLRAVRVRVPASAALVFGSGAPSSVPSLGGGLSRGVPPGRAHLWRHACRAARRRPASLRGRRRRPAVARSHGGHARARASPGGGARRMRGRATTTGARRARRSSRPTLSSSTRSARASTTPPSTSATLTAARVTRSSRIRRARARRLCRSRTSARAALSRPLLCNHARSPRCEHLCPWSEEGRLFVPAVVAVVRGALDRIRCTRRRCAPWRLRLRTTRARGCGGGRAG